MSFQKDAETGMCILCRRLEKRMHNLRHRGLQVKSTEELLQMELSARIPCEVMRPHVEALLAEAAPHLKNSGGNKVKYPGSTVVEAWTGVDQRYLYAIMEGDRQGISIEVADKLSLRSIFNMSDLLEECREWARQTGDPWPFGWHERNTTGTPTRKSIEAGKAA
jgi:hypothetical protein